MMFAVSSVLQQRAATDTPARDSLSLRLLVDLLRRRAWLAGMGCVLVAYVLEAVALETGPVALVEPIVSTELIFALPLASRLRRTSLGRREWIAAIAVSGGVGVFLAVSSPRAGNPDPGVTRWVTVALPVLSAAGVAVLAARGPESPRRAELLALAAGLCFGLLALLTQTFVALLGRGVAQAFTTWQPYALACLGLAGFTIAQSAYQSAPLAISLPIIDSVEPVASILLAAGTFGESLSVRPIALASESVGAVLAVAGVVALARSPLVLTLFERQQATRSE